MKPANLLVRVELVLMDIEQQQQCLEQQDGLKVVSKSFIQALTWPIKGSAVESL